jgi:uncharacterized membrane protein
MMRIGTTLLIGLLVLTGPARAAVTFEYILTDGYPLAFSDNGQIVAGNTTSYGAFRWTQSGGLVPLGMDPTPSPGGAPGLSIDGLKVAATILGSDSTYSVAGLWTLGSGWTELPGPPDMVIKDRGTSTVYGLSGDGSTVVGLYWRAVGRGHAFRWNQAGGAVDLGSRNGATASRANTVNSDGSLVGGWDESSFGNWCPAVWLNGVETVLADTTSDGQVNGTSPAGTIVVGFQRNNATSTRECARWTRTGSTWSATQFLGSVAGTYPNYGINSARGVTANGDMIVGYCSFDGSPYWSTGFVWTQATGTIDVVNWLANKGVAVDPGFAIDGLSGITADGQWIFGYGRDLVSPYTRRGFRIHNTDIADVPVRGQVAGLSLSAPAPNPSSGPARLAFALPAAGDADLSIFDAAGRRVATVLHGATTAGPHALAWDGRDDAGRAVDSGLYWARLATEKGSVTQRLVRLR